MNTTYLSDRPGAGQNEFAYNPEEGVLVDATDGYNPQSREAVEAHFPLDFRGGGPDPRVDTSVKVRFK